MFAEVIDCKIWRWKHADLHILKAHLCAHEIEYRNKVFASGEEENLPHVEPHFRSFFFRNNSSTHFASFFVSGGGQSLV
jgi:hypothetical protein